MTDREGKRRLLTAANKASRQMVKLWGGGIGIDLSARFFSDNPWASVVELAHLHHQSEDTVRRQLERLENIGRVVSHNAGRRKLYRAAKVPAEKAYQIVNLLCLAANCDERFP